MGVIVYYSIVKKKKLCSKKSVAKKDLAEKNFAIK